MASIVGMARRPFDPAIYGWSKTTYQRGNILDRDAVDALVAQADVVVHLAFIKLGSRAESAQVNLQGARNVFEATVAARRPRRLVYTSSMAAYGYHSDNPAAVTEDVPARGSPEHYYSEQKAQSEAELAKITEDSLLQVFVLRPCIVAGPHAYSLAEAMPCRQVPAPVRALSRVVPMLKPIVPDPGVPVQLVHHDDVAAAIALAATAPVPAGPTTSPLTGRDDHRHGQGAGRPSGPGPSGRRLGRIRGDFPVAAGTPAARMASCGATTRGDGHRQGETRTRVVADALVS
ncbi:NAD dependent epimerase/dehydratase family protein [Mycobacterium ulcerans str. Harvey]|uniref:NAD dependent epimerase/dehydratase family protein n=1 Tax=Mycobacterium ulcerans str. Harvey TaxID=1299332 RepID=A0ABN0QZS4_MYCUL|nr:NAD dependent epimerase/dehydratase family protein [Mycobacterium ulcerans str. Harvey]